MEVLFATSNQHKVAEANKVGTEFNITFTQVNIMYPEVRADSVRTVAEEGVRYVYNQIKRPIMVEDSGLFIEALNGFPGPYSAFVLSKIGLEGILKLMEDFDDRTAKFVSAIGYCNRDTIEVFEGDIEGVLTTEEKGTHGFGYDPLFKAMGSMKTFAEDAKHKNEVSHRRKATEALCRYLKSH
jgi:XTP/dITP diphosphohydrolase